MRVGKTGNELVSYSGDAISMYTHTGTHIDALNHFGYHGRIFNGFSVDEHLGSRGWRKAGVDKHPPIIARGVMLDVAGMLGVDVLEPSYGIGEEDLRGCLKHQGTELRPGDVVLVRTGRMRLWPDRATYLPNPPGLNREGAEFLAEAGAIVIGADNHCLEQAPSADPENWQVVHTYLLAEAGRAHPGDRKSRGTGRRQGLRIRLLRRLHPSARGHRGAHAPGGHAAAAIDGAVQGYLPPPSAMCPLLCLLRHHLKIERAERASIDGLANGSNRPEPAVAKRATRKSVGAIGAIGCPGWHRLRTRSPPIEIDIGRYFLQTRLPIPSATGRAFRSSADP